MRIMIKTIYFIFLALLFLSSCEDKSTEDQVVDWISENAIPINTVIPGSKPDDLLPLKDIVGEARIVSLGEPTHGNREVFLLKHRLIEYLVKEKGFHIFALECPFGEAYDINRYVVDGIGDPKKALAGIYYWTWDTQELLELIEWMRTYNVNPANTKKVKFYGFDPQDPERAARVMLEYLAKVDPNLEKIVRPELGILEVPFSIPENLGRRQYIPEEYDSSSLKEVRHVMMAFDKNKDKYIAASSTSEWTLSRQHVRQVELYIEANEGSQDYGKVRDYGQAENIKWILDQEGENGKVLVWAHNSHVSNSSRRGFKWMGGVLKEWYGDQLRIFGFFFNKGSFKALDEGKVSKGMHNFSVGPAPKGTMQYVMESAGLSVAAIDLQDLPENGTIHDWFYNPQQSRFSWGGYNEDEPNDYFHPYELAKAFDVLIYLDSTTATKPINNSDFDFVWLLEKKLKYPFNTDFENNTTEYAPEGWVTWSKFDRLGVQMIVSDKNPYEGDQALMLHRPEGLRYGEIAPNVVQRIDATPYKGKTIRLRAAARAELVNPGFAFLRLSIDPDLGGDAHGGDSPIFDSLDKYRVESTEWRIYEIEAKVPENADIISYGIHLRDFGTAWLDDVQIKIID